jgi:hypothetical protein
MKFDKLTEAYLKVVNEDVTSQLHSKYILVDRSNGEVLPVDLNDDEQVELVKDYIENSEPVHGDGGYISYDSEEYILIRLPA